MIREMLVEELDRNARARASYEAVRNSLPRGSVVVKRRGDKAYCYLKYRDGKRTVTDYAGTAEAAEADLREKVARRRAVEAAIRQLEAERRYIEKALRA